MVLPMTDTDRKKAADAPHTDDRDWRQLSANILMLALGKSERMIAEDCVDDAAFDRDARDLRLLMSSAEIADRMNRQNEKDRRSNDEQTLPQERTEEELDDIFRRVSARVDAFDIDQRARGGNTSAHDPGRDVVRDSGRRREQGMADQCA